MPEDPFLKIPSIGRCRLISRLGEGGMGVVYRGWHDDLDLPVAVKFLHPDRVADGRGAERFLREARLAARLNHPGIVRVFDCGEADGRFYIIMEFVDGQSLEAHVAERQAMGVDRSLQVVEEVARALGEAWSQVGVIHRDVKPANILLTSSGQVKLADLGLAKVAAADPASTDATVDFAGRTEAGTSLGTPAYMPPEQFLDASTVDLRADVYSLGATLYHMLAGRAPFQADSVFSLLRLIEREDPAPLPPHVPLAVEQLIAKMMAKKPGDRFQAHAELIEAVRAAQQPSGGSASLVASMLRSSSRITTSGVIPAARTAGRAVHSASPRENRVLLVVDVQNDFCPEGALAVPGGHELPAIINKLSRRFAHVVLTQDWHPEDHLSFASSHPGEKPFSAIELPYGPQILWPDHCVQDTRGAEFHPDLRLEHCELIIRKGYLREIDSYSAFFENDRTTPTGLAGYLRERGLNRLFLVGLATDFCVAYSALDARRLGFEVTVIESACRGIDLEGSLEAAWKQMEEAGVVRA
ncbi:bifunctional nicotinamidase/pyrazinamidase [Paludisphaera sp. Pla2]|uniref:nicotinamidase n=1 Tax=Paludisphaera mucosa TaxID=3030827 RepID=A0ABT6FJM0_9BACT|nr:bifunctional nicotinamidase/pyrazinamidase [Paludisphaera mucosa]MDG3007776.1 bifunctional nicotinamidase/pyrazinamidase [Paludisphaera mucosa]